MKGVTVDGSSLIRGVAFGGSGLIRGVAFDGSGWDVVSNTPGLGLESNSQHPISYGHWLDWSITILLFDHVDSYLPNNHYPCKTSYKYWIRYLIL